MYEVQLQGESLFMNCQRSMIQKTSVFNINFSGPFYEKNGRQYQTQQ